MMLSPAIAQDALPLGEAAAEIPAIHQAEDANEAVNPGREKETFRNYENSDRQAIVFNHYRMMRTHQTMDFAKRMEEKWSKFDKAELTIREAFDLLDSYVDSSDPDTGLPNVIHDFQTAEAIRAAGKPDWYQLVGLLHDMVSCWWM
jgi:inositol oxygenase